MFGRRAIAYLSAPLCALAVSAQTTDTYDSEVVNAYYRLCKPLTITTPEFSPLAASRAFGYMGITLYESVVVGMPGHSSLQGQLPFLGPLVAPQPGLTYHWPSAASHALCRMIDSLYVNMDASMAAQVHSLRDTYDASFEITEPFAVLIRSRAIGQAIAEGVLEMARGDGGHLPQFHNYDPDYMPPVGPGMWIPEPGQDPLQPHWGEKRPSLTADTIGAAQAPGPPTFSTTPGSACYDAAQEVYDVTTNITTAQLTTAAYWADGNITPPGHSISMLEQVLRNENKDLAFAARAYAMLGMALADAFVTCWRSKYHYSWQRPRNFINLYIDPDWNSWIPTPPFPEYTSGHSTQSGAWAGIMTELFSSPFTFTDSTHGALHGGPRTYADFQTCAEETAISRLYGGIHFTYANEDGQATGAAVAQNVIALFDALATGTPEITSPTVPALYFDPGSGSLHISGITAGSVSLHDMSGRSIHNFAGPGPYYLGSVTPGIYVVTMTSHPPRSERIIVR